MTIFGGGGFSCIPPPVDPRLSVTKIMIQFKNIKIKIKPTLSSQTQYMYRLRVDLLFYRLWRWKWSLSERAVTQYNFRIYKRKQFLSWNLLLIWDLQFNIFSSCTVYILSLIHISKTTLKLQETTDPMKNILSPPCSLKF